MNTFVISEAGTGRKSRKRASTGKEVQPATKAQKNNQGDFF